MPQCSMPACEDVVNDTLWLFHTLLLADAAAMHAIVAAVRKVVDNIAAVRALVP
jgi:hypothetical protein